MSQYFTDFPFYEQIWHAESDDPNVHVNLLTLAKQYGTQVLDIPKAAGVSWGKLTLFFPLFCHFLICFSLLLHTDSHLYSLLCKPREYLETLPELYTGSGGRDNDKYDVGDFITFRSTTVHRGLAPGMSPSAFPVLCGTHLLCLSINMMFYTESGDERLSLFWLSYEESDAPTVDDDYQVNPWTIYLQSTQTCGTEDMLYSGKYFYMVFSFISSLTLECALS